MKQKNNVLGYSGVVLRKFSDLKGAEATSYIIGGISTSIMCTKRVEKMTSMEREINVLVHICFASVIRAFFLGVFTILVILYFDKWYTHFVFLVNIK